MKRISALICAMMLVLAVLAPACFAADKVADDTQAKTSLEIVNSSPEDGTEGVAVDNLSIKIQFNKAVKPSDKDADVRAANAKQFKFTDEDGKKIPTRVYYSDETEGLILVAADPMAAGKNGQMKSDMEYTLHIGKNFKATDGSTLAAPQTIVVKTLNQMRSTIIYMVLMGLMMVGMVFFTIRSTKKAQEKEEEEKKKAKQAGLNPYKEAKKTGKTVAEIVEIENKKKSKQAIEEAKRREELAALEAKILEEMRKENNKRVSGPRPISAAGSDYKVKVKITKKEEPAKKKEYNNAKKSGSHGYQKKHKK